MNTTTTHTRTAAFSILALDGTGTFSCTNAIDPAKPRFFYGIQQ
jgi:hypothetical protein